MDILLSFLSGLKRTLPFTMSVAVTSPWTNYNIGIGFYLLNETFYAGLSITNMLKNTIFDLYNNTQANSTPNYYITSGYKFELVRDIYLQPSKLARVVKGARVNN